MAIYEYDHRNPHAGGFEGLRVVVSCGAQGVLQRYFRFRDRRGQRVTQAEELLLRHDASALEQRWRHLQTDTRERRRAAARPLPRGADDARNTGVAGIRATFVRDCKWRGGEWRTYYTPAFVVHGSHKSQPFTKTVRVARGTVTAGWRQAVAFYAERKQLGDDVARRLTRRRPPIAQFRMVREDLVHRLGYEIPIDRLPC